jgi:t-SNARE complex subunit (syntaxin)
MERVERIDHVGDVPRLQHAQVIVIVIVIVVVVVVVVNQRI